MASAAGVEEGALLTPRASPRAPLLDEAPHALLECNFDSAIGLQTLRDLASPGVCELQGGLDLRSFERPGYRLSSPQLNTTIAICGLWFKTARFVIWVIWTLQKRTPHPVSCSLAWYAVAQKALRGVRNDISHAQDRDAVAAQNRRRPSLSCPPPLPCRPAHHHRRLDSAPRSSHTIDGVTLALHYNGHGCDVSNQRRQ